MGLLEWGRGRIGAGSHRVREAGGDPVHDHRTRQLQLVMMQCIEEIPVFSEADLSA